MRLRHWFLLTTILSLSFSSSPAAERTIRWQVNLDAAKRLAAQTNRLVLVHFWADWCQPCKTMDQAVFSRPEVAASIEADYVPVKLHADYFPHTAQQYGVSIVPSDVILTPQGQLIERIGATTNPSQYMSALSRVAATSRNQATRSYAQISPASPAPAPIPAESRLGVRSSPESPGRPPSSDDRYADYFSHPRAAEASPSPRYAGPGVAGQVGPSLGSPAASPSAYAASAPVWAERNPPPRQQAALDSPTRSTVQLPPGNPPLGLDGYCPVQLSEGERWVLGDRRWGLVHRGRTYLFAGREERDRFDADPDRYAPVLSGNDVVVAVERNQMVPGRREIGAWFEGRVFLFASETAYQKFSADPFRYASAVGQASQEVARRPAGAARGPGRPPMDGAQPGPY